MRFVAPRISTPGTTRGAHGLSNIGACKTIFGLNHLTRKQSHQENKSYHEKEITKHDIIGSYSCFYQYGLWLVAKTGTGPAKTSRSAGTKVKGVKPSSIRRGLFLFWEITLTLITNNPKMKNLILSFVTLLCAFKAVSQNAPDLKFDQKFTSCEKKWVVFQPDATLRYPYGFIYVDMSAGFTFDLKGFISVQADGRFVADNTISQNGSSKYRLGPGTKPVAVLPSDRIRELNLKPEPDWLSIYYAGVKDTAGVYYNYRMGWIYNAAGESGIALRHLEKAYRVDPADEKVRFEMVFAYNDLGRFDDAIKLLEVDIQNKPKDFNLYKELGYAYGGAKKFDKAIEVFKKGLLLFPDNVRLDQRGEMALNTAMAYKDLNNKDEYTKWMLLAKEYYPIGSSAYNKIVASGF